MPIGYLTPAEFRATSTGQETNNLLVGDQAAQDAELARRILAAGSWFDNEHNQQSLIASPRVELHRAVYDRDGCLSIHPRAGWLNQLTAVSVGTDMTDLAALSSIAGAFPDAQNWIIPPSGIWASSAPVQLGSMRRGKLLVKLTFVAGWPNTLLTSSPTVGATSITVTDGTGFLPAVGAPVADDFTVRIIDGEFTETITVTAVAGNVLTCSALVNAHSPGAVVSALPADVKLAVGWATSAFLRDRTSDAMVMTSSLQPGQQPPSSQRWRLLQDAQRVAKNYGRTR